MKHVANQAETDLDQQARRKGIRVRPREIEVPPEDPFKHDLLERKEAVETLTHLVRNISGPCVLSVDAAWGSGKTTFIKIWTQHLRNQGFPIIEFNAWETDFAEDPFLILSTELMVGLKSSKSEQTGAALEVLKDASQEVIRWVVPSATRQIALQIPLVGEKLAEKAESLVEETLSRHYKAQTSVKSFRETLNNVAGKLSGAHGECPLIVLIDELDRCRPSYAVELLETAKHFFSVDHIVFVLAINCEQLAHSIKAVYGSEFDADEYLRRFFDVDFKLPAPDRKAFIENQLQETGIFDYFRQLSEDRSYFYDTYFMEEASRNRARGKIQAMLFLFFGSSDLNFRTIGQAIHRLGLLYASLPDDEANYGLATVAALILRTLDSELYYQFIDGKISDEEVINAIFELPGLDSQHYTEGRFAFEFVIIMAALPKDASSLSIEDGKSQSPLLKKYQSLISSDKNLVEKGEYRSEKHVAAVAHAERVVTEIVRALDQGAGQLGFDQAIRRIELFSDALIDEGKLPPSTY